jgi:hypothetical protein
MTSLGLPKTHGCIVVADDHGPEWAPTANVEDSPAPAQYSRLGERSTLLQRALNRAARVAPTTHMRITTFISAAGLLRAWLRVEQLEMSAGSRASKYLVFRV